MSQGTPMKEGRIERHLMRQRGAGVRTITADFGFSISFPGAPPVAQAHLPAEPPTKRRKTNEGLSPKKSNISAPHRTQEECVREAEPSAEPRSERSVAQWERHPEQICHEEKEITIEAQPTKQAIEPIKKPAKKPTKARRKLCVEDEVEQEKHHEGIAPQAGGPEDTFIFGLKSNKRQRKCKTEGTLVSDGTDHAGKVAPAKGKRTTKASKQAESKPIPQPVEELPVGTELAEEKPKTLRKKPTVKKPKAVSSTAGKPSKGLPEVDAIGEKSNNMATSSDMTNAMTEKITDEKPEVIESEPLKMKTAPGGPKKRNLDEVLATVADANIDVPEKASKRPRRKAAVSAIEKVTLSYEADLVPVDKLRRAPDLESKPKRSRKAADPEVVQATEPTPTRLPAPPPLGDHRCDSEEVAPSEPQPKKRGRKKAVKELDVSADPTDEEVHAGDHQIAEHACSAPTEPQLKKRGRRKAVKDVELRENKVAEESEAVGHQTAEHNTSAPPDPQPKKRGRKKAVQAPEEFDGDKVVEKSETITQRESEHEAFKDEKIEQEVVLSKQTPLPARKGRQPGSKAADVNGEPVDTSSTAEDPEKGHTTKDRSKACTEVLESQEKGTERTTASAAHQPKDIRKASTAKPSTKARRALADFDGNIVRHPSTEGPKKLGQSFSPPMKHRSKHTGPETQPEPEARSHGHFRTTQPEEPQPKAKSRGRPKKARPDEEPANLLDTEPPRSTPRTSKKRHVIRANEDLDWLFEKAEPKRTHAAVVQQPKLKGLRRKDLDRSAKEMDLDDLLESIAGFSGKLSTGQRGRATATK